MIETALLCLALNIYHEARDQSLQGMKAVAEVTMNRADGQAQNVCTQVFKPYQFSWANPLTTATPAKRKKLAKRFLPAESKAWAQSKAIARKVLLGRAKPVVPGATHYYNPNKVSKPMWAYKMQPVARVGDHSFYRLVM